MHPNTCRKYASLGRQLLEKRSSVLKIGETRRESCTGSCGRRRISASLVSARHRPPRKISTMSSAAASARTSWASNLAAGTVRGNLQLILLPAAFLSTLARAQENWAWSLLATNEALPVASCCTARQPLAQSPRLVLWAHRFRGLLWTRSSVTNTILHLVLLIILEKPRRCCFILPNPSREAPSIIEGAQVKQRAPKAGRQEYQELARSPAPWPDAYIIPFATAIPNDLKPTQPFCPSFDFLCKQVSTTQIDWKV